MRRPFLLDTRNCLITADWRRAGFEITTLGIGQSGASRSFASLAYAVTNNVSQTQNAA